MLANLIWPRILSTALVFRYIRKWPDGHHRQIMFLVIVLFFFLSNTFTHDYNTTHLLSLLFYSLSSNNCNLGSLAHCILRNNISFESLEQRMHVGYRKQCKSDGIQASLFYASLSWSTVKRLVGTRFSQLYIRK